MKITIKQMDSFGKATISLLLAGTLMLGASADFAAASKLTKSSDTKQYTESAVCPIVMDSKNPSVTKQLKITYTHLPETEGTNKPTVIELSLGKSKVSYKTSWCDGISVAVADFDTKDKYKEIYITQTGTDIETPIIIYRYDGTKITKYDTLYVLWLDFAYDGSGHLYYSRNEHKLAFDHSYNLKTKKTAVITDKPLLTRLKQLLDK